MESTQPSGEFAFETDPPRLKRRARGADLASVDELVSPLAPPLTAALRDRLRAAPPGRGSRRPAGGSTCSSGSRRSRRSTRCRTTRSSRTRSTTPRSGSRRWSRSSAGSPGTGRRVRCRGCCSRPASCCSSRATCSSAYYEHIVGETPFPSTADALYLLAYPVLAAGLWLLVRQRSTPDRLDEPDRRGDRHASRSGSWRGSC